MGQGLNRGQDMQSQDRGRQRPTPMSWRDTPLLLVLPPRASWTQQNKIFLGLFNRKGASTLISVKCIVRALNSAATILAINPHRSAEITQTNSLHSKPNGLRPDVTTAHVKPTVQLCGTFSPLSLDTPPQMFGDRLASAPVASGNIWRHPRSGFFFVQM